MMMNLIEIIIIIHVADNIVKSQSGKCKKIKKCQKAHAAMFLSWRSTQFCKVRFKIFSLVIFCNDSVH